MLRFFKRIRDWFEGESAYAQSLTYVVALAVLWWCFAKFAERPTPWPWLEHVISFIFGK